MRRAGVHRSRVLPILLTALAAGCGSDYYEQRLQATVAQFQYFEKLNQALYPTAWSGGGVSIRIPREFRAIPAPAAPPQSPAAEEDNGESGNTQPTEPVEDPRQPDYLAGDVTLPGLAGAWWTEVPLRAGETARAYFYVLSNYDLWLQEGERELAEQFHNRATERIAHGFGVGIQPEHWRTRELPPKPGYIASKQYTATTLDPKPKIADQPMDVSVYLLAARDNKAAFVSVIPSDARNRQQLQESISHGLETAKLSESRPRAGQEKRPSGGGGQF